MRRPPLDDPATSSAKVAIKKSSGLPASDRPCPRHSMVMRSEARSVWKNLCGLRSVAAEPVLEDEGPAFARRDDDVQARRVSSRVWLTPRLPARVRCQEPRDARRFRGGEAMRDQGRRIRPGKAAEICGSR